MGAPERAVVAVLGDGSTLYAIQALWSAARYRVGLLVIVMANGSYAVMDALARDAGGTGAWPRFDNVQISAIAEAFGCPSRRIAGHDELLATLDEVLPEHARRRASSRCCSRWRWRRDPPRRQARADHRRCRQHRARDGAGVRRRGRLGPARRPRRRRARARGRRARQRARRLSRRRHHRQRRGRGGGRRHRRTLRLARCRVRQRGHLRDGRGGDRLSRSGVRAGPARQCARAVPGCQARAARDGDRAEA